MMQTALSLLERFKEPSSWAGFAGLAAAAGVSAPAYSVIATVGAALCGAVAFVLRERAR